MTTKEELQDKLGLTDDEVKLAMELFVAGKVEKDPEVIQPVKDSPLTQVEERQIFQRRGSCFCLGHWPKT